MAISTISLLILGIRAGSQLRRAARADASGADLAGEHEYLRVFMVPALNEETVIADSVGRLTEVRVTHKRILVINDGSDDGTGEVLAGISEPDLTVLTRVAPNARQGKSEALNDARRYLHRVVLGEGPYRGWGSGAPRRWVIGVLLARRRSGVGEFFVGLLLAHLYLIYSWLIYPVVYRSLLRQLTGSKSWVKTKREAIAPADAGPASASA